MPLTVDLSLNVKLVEIIKDFPCLYNSFLPDYFKRDVTDDAWDQVSKLMSEPVTDCKQKWRNLRTVYVRKIKTGSLLEGKRKRPYYLTKVMEFLRPFVRVKEFQKATTGNTTSSEFEFVEAELSNSGDGEVNEFDDEIQLGDDYHQKDTRVKIEDTKTSQAHAGRSDEDNESTTGPASEKDVSYSPSRKRKFDQDNPRKQFLLSMEPDIQIMTDAQMRQFKRKVLEIVDDILNE